MARDQLKQWESINGERVYAEKGETRRYKGQAYLCEGVEFVELPNDNFNTVLRWSTGCAECGARVEFFGPVERSEIYPSRRCEVHRRPGKQA